MLRRLPGPGLRVRRSRKLLWKGFLNMGNLDEFLDNLQDEIFEEAR